MRLDHRPAVAIQRREKMRARLIEAAVLVVAGKGLENTVIDDIVAQAGVSRGTFYNHFAAVPDLMLAAQEELSNEILVDVEAAVRVIPKPDQRLAHGIFLFMATASAFPLLGHFVKRWAISASQNPVKSIHFLPNILRRELHREIFAQFRCRSSQIFWHPPSAQPCCANAMAKTLMRLELLLHCCAVWGSSVRGRKSCRSCAWRRWCSGLIVSSRAAMPSG